MNKKSIAFFVSSNGVGHLERVRRVASFLQNHFRVTIYCTQWQWDFLLKTGHHDQLLAMVKFIEPNNLKWNDIMRNNEFDFKEYISYIEQYKDEINEYDIFVSDNLAGFIEHRKSTILMGSFFWYDVFEDYFGENELTKYEKYLIQTFKPTIITNKYLETKSVKEYTNKLQFGWGLPRKKKNNKKFKLEKLVFIKPSMNYLDYQKSMEDISNNSVIETSEDINDISNSLFFIRPGGGMTTYCVSNNIPFVSMVDGRDSIEMEEIASNLSNENLTLVHNVENEFDYNLIYDYINNFNLNQNMEFNSYEKIANYFKSLV